MNMKTYAGAVAAIVLVGAPLVASADSSSTPSQIQTIMSQIQALQLQLKNLLMQNASSSTPGMGGWMKDGVGGMMGSSTIPGQIGKAMCVTINRTIKLGSQGDDVKSIQQMLSDDQDSDFHGGITGFFGKLTAQAMMKFQMKNGIASSTDGTVGPMTRGFFERRCGKGMDDSQGMGSAKPPMGMDGEHGNVMVIGGTISAASAASITVAGPNNESKTFTITASTTIEVFAGTSTPATTGTIADLVVGKNVLVTGSSVNGSTMTARDIRVGMVPPMQGMQGAPGRMMMVNPESGEGHGPLPMMDDGHPNRY